MAEPIEDLYFGWLCAKVLTTPDPVYRDLMHILYTTEFLWVVPMDQNRADDGLELRIYFLRELNIPNEMEWYESPCSVLEVLIAFSGRAEFQTDMPAREWFWTFMTNLDLEEYRRVSIEDRRVIENILNAFIWRRYGSDGHGGLFPLRQPKKDQRQVEIWYQFFEYLEDQGLA